MLASVGCFTVLREGMRGVNLGPRLALLQCHGVHVLPSEALSPWGAPHECNDCNSTRRFCVEIGTPLLAWEVLAALGQPICRAERASSEIACSRNAGPKCGDDTRTLIVVSRDPRCMRTPQ
eukprot:365306-Chlamydomonas_euryale.AAC.4